MRSLPLVLIACLHAYSCKTSQPDSVSLDTTGEATAFDHDYYSCTFEQRDYADSIFIKEFEANVSIGSLNRGFRLTRNPSDPADMNSPSIFVYNGPDGFGTLKLTFDLGTSPPVALLQKLGSGHTSPSTFPGPLLKDSCYGGTIE